MRSEIEIRKKINDIKLKFTDDLFNFSQQINSKTEIFSLKEARIRIDTLLWALEDKKKFNDVQPRTKIQRGIRKPKGRKHEK